MPDYEDWLEFSAQDIVAARAASRSSEFAPRIVCFHAQQAAEKALKAVLVRHGVRFPRTHSLIALEALLPDSLRAKTAPVDIASLNVWAVDARYPSDLPEPTESDAANSVKVAEELLNALGLGISPPE